MVTDETDEVSRTIRELQSMRDPETSRLLRGILERQLRLLRRVAALEQREEAGGRSEPLREPT